MSTATAWQTHGCYSLDSTQYYNMPWDAARRGCHDDKISLDHRDPSAPVRNILKRMFDLRRSFPVLQDGFFLQQLSNQTWEVLYPGSSGVATETGLWSVLRNGYPGVQSLTNEPITNDTVPQHAFSGLNSLSNLTQSAAVQPEPASPVWLVYTNLNASKTYLFDCSDNATDLNSTSMMAPFPHGTTVKNLLPPYQEHTLVSSTRALGISNSSENNGCLESLKMMAYDYRAYVPIDLWTGPKPMITHFSPGHDARIVSKSADISATEDLEVRLEFSTAMECENVTSSITFTSKTDSGAYPYIDLNSVECSQVDQQESNLVGEVISAWAWSATIKGLAHGVHRMTVDHPKAATASQRDSTTGARDHFLFRVGQANNPIVFTRSANYSSTLLGNAHHGRLLLNHSAAGADLYRYSLDFGDTFTEWTPYLGGAEEISAHSQSNKKKTWQGEHVR
jgi:alpha-1,3-glucan synthase